MKNGITILALCIVQLSFGQKKLDQLLKQYNDNGVPYISVEELAMPSTKATLLDTREEDEYKLSHLKDAIHVGYDHFNITNFIKNNPDKDKTIVVYCSLGIRSETVGEKLKEAGYTDIKNLYGGIFEWKNKKMKVYNHKEQETDSVHAFSKTWSKWLKNGIKYYPKKKTN